MAKKDEWESLVDVLFTKYDPNGRVRLRRPRLSVPADFKQVVLRNITADKVREFVQKQLRAGMSPSAVDESMRPLRRAFRLIIRASQLPPDAWSVLHENDAKAGSLR